jgi:hypothetical protein
MADLLDGDGVLALAARPLPELIEDLDHAFAGDPARREVAGALVLEGVRQGLSPVEAHELGTRLAREVTIAGNDDPAARSRIIREMAASRPGGGSAP